MSPRFLPPPVRRHPVARRPGQVAFAPTAFAPAAFALALLGLWPGIAFAHAFLVRASPAVGATLAAAPARLTLFYTEAVVPHFCQVTLRGPGGAAVPVGRPRPEAGHPRVLLVRLPHLVPGRYTVTWHAVASDTHRTEGSFAFTVAGGKR